MLNNEFRQKGQSLIEVLIYVAVFGAIAASLMGVVWSITKIHSTVVASNEVDSNLSYAMNLINYKVRSASSVESATSSTLVLKMSNNTITTFSVTDGVLYLQEGSADPVAVNSDRVAVSGLTFEKIDMPNAKGGARVNLTLTYVPKEGDAPNLKKTLISAITQSATAITFSEDIVPGQDNSYSVGSASFGWKNGYFSEDVTVDGTISGTTFCISSDCKTAWPSGGGGSVTGTGTTNKVAKWTSSSALGDSLIRDDGANVGIGETNPASGAILSVVGSATFAGVSGAWNGGLPYLQISNDSTTTYLDQKSSGRNLHIRAKSGGGTLGDQLFLQAGGSVGIGTTSPGSKLEVYDSTDELLRLTRVTASYPTKFKVGTDSAFVINSGNSDVLAIKSGKVGIGLTSPTSTLAVAGTVESTTGGFKFPDGTTQTTAAGASSWITSGNDIYNSNSGNVGIGTSPQAGMRMDIRSDINIDGSSAITSYGYNGNGGRAIKGHGYATTGTGNNTGITGISTGSRAAGTNIGGYFSASGAATNYALVTASGNVGIGDATPSYQLDVSGDVNITGALREDGVEIFSGMIAMFDATCPIGWTRFSALDNIFPVGSSAYGTTGGSSSHTHSVNPPETTTSTVADHRHSQTGGSGIRGGSGSAYPAEQGFSTSYAGGHSHTVDVSSFDSGSVSSLPPYMTMVYCKKNVGADVAEWTLTREKYEQATLVSLDSSIAKTVKASDKPYDLAMAGIVSTEPGWILGRETSQKALLALSGQVPLKVSTTNGLIKIGDPITSSAIMGVGMKATEAGPIVAKAMEDFNPDNLTQIVLCPKGTLDGVVCGKIMVLISVSWYGGDASKSLIGGLVEKVKRALASLGIWVENQVVKVKELLADKISAKRMRLKELEMIDKTTGDIYCAWINNGEWTQAQGECE